MATQTLQNEYLKNSNQNFYTWIKLKKENSGDYTLKPTGKIYYNNHQTHSQTLIGSFYFHGTVLVIIMNLFDVLHIEYVKNDDIQIL